MTNPFHPTFGRSPAVIGGRDEELDSFQLALAEGPGNPWRTALISGTRGIGKTVLLNEFEEAARQLGWIVLRAHTGPDMVAELRDVTIPRALQQIDSAPASASRKLTGISVAGIGGITTDIRDNRPAPGQNLLSQLQDLTAVLAPQGSGILLTLDEVQSAAPEQLTEIAHAIQDLNRDEAEIAFVAAGLPSGIEDLLQLDGTTFLRRAERVPLGRLDSPTTEDIIRRTSDLGSRSMTEDAVELAAQISHGYPYLIQTIGSVAWAKARLANADTITAEHVAEAGTESIRRIGRQVHAPSLKNVPPRQIEFLKSMAELAPDGAPVAVKDVAEKMGRKVSGVSQLRHDLIYRELIVPASVGHIEFSLPYFADYLLSLVD
nr:ATP-binding protein [Corynebacterium lactis]